MVKLFKEDKNQLICFQDLDNIISKIEKNMWIHLVAPSTDELKEISKIVKINEEVLIGLLDDEESARLDLDDDFTLIVLDIPVLIDNYYETYPFAIIYNNDYYLTICKKDIKLVDLMMKKFKKIEPHKHVRLTLQIMYRISSNYISSLKILDSRRNEIEKKVRDAMTNNELLDLMTINKSLVYFSTSLNANKVVLNKLKRLNEYKRYEDDFDLMEDVEVENNQAIEMCTIYRDILSGMMDAFASIISNNLNSVMKALAIITLIISIPTLIASLFGMNVKVPFGTNSNGFYIIIGISAIIAIIGGVLLYVYTSKRNYNKKRKK